VALAEPALAWPSTINAATSPRRSLRSVAEVRREDRPLIKPTISHSDECESMVDAVAKDFGHVDILVNNAASPATSLF